MKLFDITIDLVTYTKYLDAIPDYGNRQVSPHLHKTPPKWDVALTNTVEAETAEDAAATIGDDMRKAFSHIDPDWHGLIFQDDNEVLELDADGDTYFHPRPVNKHGQELIGKLSKENLDHQKSYWDRKIGDWTNDEC